LIPLRRKIGIEKSGNELRQRDERMRAKSACTNNDCLSNYRQIYKKWSREDRQWRSRFGSPDLIRIPQTLR